MQKSADVEKETQRIGREILERLKVEKYSILQREWWGAQVLTWAMHDEAFKVALFQFIDVLPTLKRSRDVVRLLREYFDIPGRKFPPVMAWGMKALTPGSPAGALASRTLRANVMRMAQQFIIGTDLDGAFPGLQRLWEEGKAFSISLLGEVAVNEEESRRYAVRYAELLERLSSSVRDWKPLARLEGDRFGKLPRANLSVKISSLYSQMDPMDWDGSRTAVCDRLRPIMERAKESGSHVHLDMEHYFYKDLTLSIFFRIMEEDRFAGFCDAGVVVQAYLPDSEADLQRVVKWARERRRPVTIRLVKGAYWDYETVVNSQKGWPIPVYLDKGLTDRNFERMADLIFDHADVVRPAFGGHNVRSIARAIASARARGIPPSDYEFQVLYGMGGPLESVLSGMGFRVRVYAPIGELIPGMAYLVRRLLENTSNESFVRKNFLERQPPESVLAPPRLARGARRPEETGDGFKNEPPADFSRQETRDQMEQALSLVRKRMGRFIPLVIGGHRVRVPERIRSLNPARPDELVGEVASATPSEADRAVEAALKAYPEWSRVPPKDRADLLCRAAGEMRLRRYELAAWEVYEVGKTWREADADVTEAIDFFRYYAREMVRLAVPRSLGHFPGERNLYVYRPRGIGLVISPWNFPLAIPAGMVSAALVTGNCVIFKPSNLSPVMGSILVETLKKAGVPDGALIFLPGPGESVGGYLVRHPDISFIAFTGSKPVGLRIVEEAGRTVPGQRQIKRVVAEMGGKNAIIVDDTADLDMAVQGVVASAMGYQGQKCSACSRVILLDAVYDEFLDRAVKAINSLKIGPPENPAHGIGPVIDRAAQEKIRAYIAKGHAQGRVVVAREAPAEGFYVGPALVADVRPEDSLAQEEIFGPVVTVLRAKDFEEALRIANGVDYALTGGIYSRSPANIKRAMDAFEVGNLYINRGITGALVGRQPFGGFRMSGIGSKAGGPDYLTQFMIARAISENTLRRGFAPSDGPE